MLNLFLMAANAVSWAAAIGLIALIGVLIVIDFKRTTTLARRVKNGSKVGKRFAASLPF